MPKIVVIGGGISGLTTAHQLRDRIPGADIRLLEASPRAGGAIGTCWEAGYTCETGPHGFLNAHPSTLSLAVRLGLAPRLLPACETSRRRFILVDDRLRAFPHSPAALARTDLLSITGRLRLLLEPLVDHKTPLDDTVAHFFRRRFGEQATERVVEPLVAGIYGGDIDRLDFRAALPQIAAAAGRGSLLGLALKRLQRQQHERIDGGLHRRLISFTGGTAELISALQRSLGPALHCNSSVASVDRDGRSFRVSVTAGDRSRTLRADTVVVTTPPRTASALIGHLHPALRGALADFPMAPLAVVALGLNRADIGHALDGFGYLVPRSENSCVLGVLWSSSMFPGHRSPPGSVLVQAILGGTRQTGICDLPDSTVLETVAAQLETALRAKFSPRLVRIFRHPQGLPQYETGHAQRVSAIEQARVPGLFLGGNAFRGIGINACTREAERVAESVCNYLGSLASPRSSVTSRGRRVHSNATSAVRLQSSSP